MPQRVFIDGEVGTTGLEIFTRLKERPDLHILQLPTERRKDADARAEALNSCDLAVLCLPDDAAIEAVSLIENDTTRVLDASTAHRIKPDWVYGFAEMAADQASKIAAAKRVANPGCYATGAIAILRPLIETGVLATNYPVTLNAVSGYTGGGKSLIAAFEDPASPDRLDTRFYEYGLGFQHKHVPEISVHAGLTAPVLFVPSVAGFPRGMLVNMPLQLWSLGSSLTGRDLHAIFSEHYSTAGQVRVQPLILAGDKTAPVRIEADALANTDWLDLYIIANDRSGQAMVTTSFDNLGKGACGAAIQNIGLMLGIPHL